MFAIKQMLVIGSVVAKRMEALCESLYGNDNLVVEKEPQMSVCVLQSHNVQERPQLASTSNVNRPSISNHGPYDNLLLMRMLFVVAFWYTLSRSQAIREPTYDPNDLGRRPGGS
ncbi:hypothetical protein Tco_1563675 [Tanacetum coccineum]